MFESHQMTRLEYERRKQGLTQKDLAARSGVHQSDLCALEKRNKPFYPGWSERLADALGWDVADAPHLADMVEAPWWCF